jgi:tetratricopeptide (TPR) repeat protein
MAPTRRFIAFAGPIFLSAAMVVGQGGCKRARRPVPARAPSKVQAPSAAPAAGAAAPATEEASSAEVRPLRRCFDEVPVWVDPPVADLLDRAGDLLDEGDIEGVLACAEEAARQNPRSVEAHHNRALALIRLGRLDEARDALGLALAIAPADSESLELAAELYINRLAPTAERTSIGLEYARRGRRVAPGADRLRSARLALLEGQALVDLGRAGEALRPLVAAVKLDPDDVSARYEQGVALFELCRFDAARGAFEDALAREAGHAHALYHLALIREREGRESDSGRLFRQASERDPKSFPPIPAVSRTNFDARVKRVVSQLPADVRKDLGDIPIETAEIPALEDLTAERPPLSPTILGLFRGLPLGREPATIDTLALARGARGRQARVTSGAATAEATAATCAVPARAIVLYRLNILRSIRGADELDRAIERTLLHEVGHLRGEDDGSLRDRGLE